MLKYINYDIVTGEVPDELTLAINLSNCPIHCKGCHSDYLWKDVGYELTYDELKKLIDYNVGITCVSFMGGDNDPGSILDLTTWMKKDYPYLKACWYSGKTQDANQNLGRIFHKLVSVLDYIKMGPYIEKLGGLEKKGTNQIFYQLIHEDGVIRFINRMDWFQNKNKDI